VVEFFKKRRKGRGNGLGLHKRWNCIGRGIIKDLIYGFKL